MRFGILIEAGGTDEGVLESVRTDLRSKGFNCECLEKIFASDESDLYVAVCKGTIFKFVPFIIKERLGIWAVTPGFLILYKK